MKILLETHFLCVKIIFFNPFLFRLFSSRQYSIYFIILVMAASGRAISKFFVGNIHWTIGHRELRDYFREFGRVVAANVVFDKKTGVSKGYGFVVFNQANVAENIENKQRLVLEGHTLNVQKTT